MSKRHNKHLPSNKLFNENYVLVKSKTRWKRTASPWVSGMVPSRQPSCLHWRWVHSDVPGSEGQMVRATIQYPRINTLIHLSYDYVRYMQNYMHINYVIEKPHCYDCLLYDSMNFVQLTCSTSISREVRWVHDWNEMTWHPMFKPLKEPAILKGTKIWYLFVYHHCQCHKKKWSTSTPSYTITIIPSIYAMNYIVMLSLVLNFKIAIPWSDPVSCTWIQKDYSSNIPLFPRNTQLNLRLNPTCLAANTPLGTQKNTDVSWTTRCKCGHLTWSKCSWQNLGRESTFHHSARHFRSFSPLITRKYPPRN